MSQKLRKNNNSVKQTVKKNKNKNNFIVTRKKATRRAQRRTLVGVGIFELMAKTGSISSKRQL